MPLQKAKSYDFEATFRVTTLMYICAVPSFWAYVTFAELSGHVINFPPRLVVNNLYKYIYVASHEWERTRKCVSWPAAESFAAGDSPFSKQAGFQLLRERDYPRREWLSQLHQKCGSWIIYNVSLSTIAGEKKEDEKKKQLHRHHPACLCVRKKAGLASADFLAKPLISLLFS